MLTLREKLIILYATAPVGFSATANDLVRKFSVERNSIYLVLRRMKRKEELEKVGRDYLAGPVLRDEVGAP